MWRAAGDDQRNARLVEQNRIGFIDQGHGEGPVYLGLRVQGKLIAKIIEADLVCRGVGDIARIGALALLYAHALLDSAYLEPEELINSAHPVGVAAGQIIVDGHDVDTLAGLRIPDDGWNGGKSLALARLHLGDLAIGERQGPAHLDIEHLQPEHARRDYGGDGGELEEILRSIGSRSQVVIAELGELGAAAVDEVDTRLGGIWAGKQRFQESGHA